MGNARSAANVYSQVAWFGYQQVRPLPATFPPLASPGVNRSRAAHSPNPTRPAAWSNMPKIDHKLIEQTCRECGKRFMARADRVRRGVGGFYCSETCSGPAVTRARLRLMTRPTSTKQQRKKAKAVIERRVSRGELIRPDRCELCGKLTTVDGHHEDYHRPDLVIWLCRSCHTKQHYQRTG